jgi:RNA polymerase sigma factor (sigma-70 family)
LLVLARDGHDRAFEALVERYRRPLLAYCRRLLPTSASAEDVLQQGLLQAWFALQRGAEVDAVKAWLYRIVRNAAIKARQMPGNDHVELTHSIEGADTLEVQVARRSEFRQALAEVAALPVQQREALVQTAIVGNSHGEVAARLGVSEPAVRGLVYRARGRLRAALGAICPLPLTVWSVQLTRRVPGLDGSGAVGAAVGATLTRSGAVLLTAGALVTAGETARLGQPTRPRTAAAPSAARKLEPSASRAAKALTPAAAGSSLTSVAVAAGHPGSADVRQAASSQEPTDILSTAGAPDFSSSDTAPGANGTSPNEGEQGSSPASGSPGPESTSQSEGTATPGTSGSSTTTSTDNPPGTENATGADNGTKAPPAPDTSGDAPALPEPG